MGSVARCQGILQRQMQPSRASRPPSELAARALCAGKKVVHKTTTTDDKRLQNTLNRLGINSIPAIEEVNLFMDQGEVIHFTNPKVQASIAANTYVIIGHAETKKLQDLFPGILNQVDKSVLSSLKKIAEQYGQSTEADDVDDEDDEVPDLVENFEEASK